MSHVRFGVGCMITPLHRFGTDLVKGSQVRGRQTPLTEGGYTLGQAPRPAHVSARRRPAKPARRAGPPAGVGARFSACRDEDGDRSDEANRAALWGPYLELFGRKSVRGWAVWDNEVPRETFLLKRFPPAVDDVSSTQAANAAMGDRSPII